MNTALCSQPLSQGGGRGSFVALATASKFCIAIGNDGVCFATSDAIAHAGHGKMCLHVPCPAQLPVLPRSIVSNCCWQVLEPMGDVAAKGSCASYLWGGNCKQIVPQDRVITAPKLPLQLAMLDAADQGCVQL